MASTSTIRDAALSMPETVEKTAWGHPTFRVRDLIFVGYDMDNHRATVRTDPETQQSLIEGDGDTYSSAPRVGRFGWVSVNVDRADDDELTELVQEAWRSVAPKRLLEPQTAGSPGD